MENIETAQVKNTEEGKDKIEDEMHELSDIFEDDVELVEQEWVYDRFKYISRLMKETVRDRRRDHGSHPVTLHEKYIRSAE